LSQADKYVSLTGLEVLARMQRYAAGFQASGVRPGDRVCVHLTNSVENFVAMFGCIFAGATVVLAKTSLTERELLYQMSDGDATHVVTNPEFAEKVLKVGELLKLKGLFVMGEVPGFISASPFSKLDEGTYREVPIEDPRNTVLALTYTSGTTGLPKGVEITHYNLVGAFYTLRSIFGGRTTDVMLAWNPITHSSGLFSVTRVMTGCGNVIAPTTMGFQEFVNTVNNFKITGLTVFPSRLQNIVNEMLRTGIQLPTVTSISVAGGVITETLVQRTLAAFGNVKSIRNMYAMSECCTLLCVSPVPGVSYADVGMPGPMVEIKIVDVTTGRNLEPNETGELCFRSPLAIRGYYKKPEATAQFRDKDGWCHSGDLAYYDDQGRIYFVERVKEMIKCKGNQVVPAELEGLLLARHKGIAEVCVVGLPHEEMGEVPAAFVVLKDTHKAPGKVTEKDIKDIIAGSCAEHKQLRGGVFFVDSLPRNETGKVHRKALAEKASR
ncbi:unnamed protein product, partial [Ixodes hexagonus]